jgi:hypothetical protein
VRRAEGQQGKIAVGWVVRNRAKEARRHRAGTGKNHPLFGDGSLEVACTARMQFSCRNLSEPNRKPSWSRRCRMRSTTGGSSTA